VELDDTDRALFALLQRNARMPMAEIARALGVSRPTATRRLERLLDEGALRLLAETDLGAAGRDLIVVLGVKVEGQAVGEVALALAELEQTIAVNSVAGRYDIEVLIAADSHEALARLLTQEIPSIGGVGERSPSLCLEVVKFDSNQVPFFS
jgi:DNA-binding Lrp family transcriptional regulator